MEILVLVVVIVVEWNNLLCLTLATARSFCKCVDDLCDTCLSPSGFYAADTYQVRNYSALWQYLLDQTAKQRQRPASYALSQYHHTFDTFPCQICELHPNCICLCE